jgi:hypothetical protein
VQNADSDSSHSEKNKLELQVGFWVPRGRGYEECCLQECHALQHGGRSLVFRKILLPPSSVSENKATNEQLADTQKY